MHKLIAALALGTSAFAVTSIYLWSELRDARGRIEVLSASASARQSALETRTLQGAEPASTEASQLAAGGEAARSPNDDAKTRQKLFDEDYRDGVRRKLAQLTDPAMRAEMREEWKEASLHNKPGYARYLGISEADAERLIDLLADQNLVQSEAYARCALQPPCDYGSLMREFNAARQLAIADLLGAEVQRRFEQYEYTDMERSLVSNFLRDKLPVTSQFSDVQAEKLISALADERKSFETEIKQRGSEPSHFPMEGVAFTFASNMYEPGNTSERLEMAADFNRRIHARAKEILTPQQLLAFEQMQEQAIVGIKSVLRQQERDRATKD